VNLNDTTGTVDQGSVMNIRFWQIAARVRWLSWCLVGRGEVSRLVSRGRIVACSVAGLCSVLWSLTGDLSSPLTPPLEGVLS